MPMKGRLPKIYKNDLECREMSFFIFGKVQGLGFGVWGVGVGKKRKKSL